MFRMHLRYHSCQPRFTAIPLALSSLVLPAPWPSLAVVCCIVEMTDWFALLSDDLLLLVLERVATAKDLGCARGVNVNFRRQSDSESLWAHWCESEGITRAGSSRPTSRTYCSWLQTWREARCAECGDTYVAKINLDGGSSQATMWHGLKVPLCGAHACGEY